MSQPEVKAILYGDTPQREAGEDGFLIEEEEEYYTVDLLPGGARGFFLPDQPERLVKVMIPDGCEYYAENNMISTRAMVYLDERNRLHRDGGPAIDFLNGAERWYKHGQLHRDVGPAVINSDGTKEYWRAGIQVC